MAIRTLTTPLDTPTVRELHAGDEVMLDGIIYTARDAAHQRLIACLDAAQSLPFDPAGQIIYYTGPTPAPPGMPIGSAGPTTAGRMDRYAPQLIKRTGLAGMIAKGERSQAVIDAMVACGCVYFAAIGGAGALISQCVRTATVIAWPELGPEAIYRLEVTALPLIVAIDSHGTSLYVQGPRRWQRPCP